MLASLELGYNVKGWGNWTGKLVLYGALPNKMNKPTQFLPRDISPIRAPPLPGVDFCHFSRTPDGEWFLWCALTAKLSPYRALLQRNIIPVPASPPLETNFIWVYSNTIWIIRFIQTNTNGLLLSQTEPFLQRHSRNFDKAFCYWSRSQIKPLPNS